MSNRDELIAYVQGVLAAVPGLEGVQTVKSARAVSQLNKPTLAFKTQSYTKTAAAPLSKRTGEFLLTLISPLVDLDDAEDQLDDLLELLLPALLTSGIVWESATQVDFGDQYLAYDITVTSILS